jgi:hypothetical protein
MKAVVKFMQESTIKSLFQEIKAISEAIGTPFPFDKDTFVSYNYMRIQGGPL